LRFVPESGLEVLCQARLSVYEPRGEYQLIIEVMEPQGLGALQLAFEQLKKKLEAEGLFDPKIKRAISSCPQRIAIVTSPTGAAIRDILKVLQRSASPLSITLFPVRVQGQEAAGEIAAALEASNRLAEEFKWDVIIVGRGGGSIEDLWPFNEEIVARAIAASQVPTISAVGHEIDFTISDLVADMRVPTPTAAAEWIVSQLERLHRDLSQVRERILQAAVQKISGFQQQLGFLQKRLVHPQRRLADLRLFIDDRLERLQLALTRRLERLRTMHAHLSEKLGRTHPSRDIQAYRALLDRQRRELLLHGQKIVDGQRFRLRNAAAQLESLSPLAVLARGYSITYLLPEKKVLRKASEVERGQEVLVQLAEGHLECRVQNILE
jgi:exodeoxyribonuclease VII large subunit